MFHDPFSSLDSVRGTENFHRLAAFRAEVSITPFPPQTVLLLPPTQRPQSHNHP